MSWRSRLENTQNHTPEDLGMSELAHKDVGEAVERIKELEQQIDELLVDAHKFKECISENMRTIGGLKQQLEGADDVNLRLKMEFIAAMQEVERLREALEKALGVLVRCADEWEGLSDSTLPRNIQEHHRKIAVQVGEVLTQIEQALGKE